MSITFTHASNHRRQHGNRRCQQKNRRCQHKNRRRQPENRRRPSGNPRRQSANSRCQPGNRRRHPLPRRRQEIPRQRQPFSNRCRNIPSRCPLFPNRRQEVPTRRPPPLYPHSSHSQYVATKGPPQNHKKWLVRLAPGRCGGVSPNTVRIGLKIKRIQPQMNRMNADGQDENVVFICVLHLAESFSSAVKNS